MGDLAVYLGQGGWTLVPGEEGRRTKCRERCGSCERNVINLPGPMVTLLHRPS